MILTMKNDDITVRQKMRQAQGYFGISDLLVLLKAYNNIMSEIIINDIDDDQQSVSSG